jgi:outer membrane lipoprotein LolB
MRQPQWLLLLFLVLNACSGVAVKETASENRPAYENRLKALGEVTEWGFAGKISLDDGDQGGSGKLLWSVEPGGSSLNFHGAMGRGAWHLQTGPNGAVLKEANGDVQTGPDVNDLIQDRMGWPIPVDALQWWVRGLAAPGLVEEEKLDNEGRLLRLTQFGWMVNFNRYDSIGDVALPKRLDVTRNNYRVKLAISRWRMETGLAPRN